jgi:hypothetical protein
MTPTLYSSCLDSIKSRTQSEEYIFVTLVNHHNAAALHWRLQNCVLFLVKKRLYSLKLMGTRNVCSITRVILAEVLSIDVEADGEGIEFSTKLDTYESVRFAIRF